MEVFKGRPEGGGEHRLLFAARLLRLQGTTAVLAKRSCDIERRSQLHLSHKCRAATVNDMTVPLRGVSSVDLRRA